MKEYKKRFIKFMMENNALKFGEFITKSGRKTPYFINIGSYNKGSEIKKLGEFYSECIQNEIDENVGDENTLLFGPAYKGIPLTIATSVALAEKGIDRKVCFNRKEIKNHGEGGLFVGGELKEGVEVYIIEDVITAGTAIREVLPLIEETKAKVKGIIVSVDRMEVGKDGKRATKEIEKDFGIKTFSIVNIKDIIEFLEEEEGYKEILGNMKKYREKYAAN